MSRCLFFPCSGGYQLVRSRVRRLACVRAETSFCVRNRVVERETRPGHNTSTTYQIFHHIEKVKDFFFYPSHRLHTFPNYESIGNPDFQNSVKSFFCFSVGVPRKSLARGKSLRPRPPLVITGSQRNQQQTRPLSYTRAEEADDYSGRDVRQPTSSYLRPCRRIVACTVVGRSSCEARKFDGDKSGRLGQVINS